MTSTDYIPAAHEGRAPTGHLATIWPRPRKWSDLVPTLGVAGAARTMVIYDNIAQVPHNDGWMGVSGAIWHQAYIYGVRAIQEIVAVPGALSVEAAKNVYDTRMEAFAKPFPAKSPKGQWSYALGMLATKATRHPFHLSPVDILRWQYLPTWGWGVDPRVGDFLSFGALYMPNLVTGLPSWRAVKGIERRLSYLSPESFATEQEALDFVRGIVESQYLSPPGQFGA